MPTSVLSFGDNRFSTTKTLYDIYYNKVPSLEYLKVFDCAVYLIL